MTQQAAASRPVLPVASSSFDRFPQLPYDRNRAESVTALPNTTLELEAGGCLELEAGGCLELEGAVVGGVVQYRPGAVAFS